MVERTNKNNNNFKKLHEKKHNCYLNYGAVITTVYRVGQKKLRQIFLAITLVNMDRF